MASGITPEFWDGLGRYMVEWSKGRPMTKQEITLWELAGKIVDMVSRPDMVPTAKCEQCERRRKLDAARVKKHRDQKVKSGSGEEASSGA